jgi:hypothetical protein
MTMKVEGGMAYAQPGDDSDVYVWTDGHEINCGGCGLYNVKVFSFTVAASEPQQMIDHLLKHRDRGEKVPGHALERLTTEAEAKKAKDESTSVPEAAPAT